MSKVETKSVINGKIVDFIAAEEGIILYKGHTERLGDVIYITIDDEVIFTIQSKNSFGYGNINVELSEVTND